MRIRSMVTDRIYEQEDMVYLVNPVQIAKYIAHKLTLFDLLGSEDGQLVGVFSKHETKELYQKWQRREI